ncbi:MAG: hypothetical protein D3914_13050 [Candidatus Electrothrix sp. LOE2]|jgi:hypothetical protein|nr:hypothetical protein [Candidatus Electrothrix sp. LOE2]
MYRDERADQKRTGRRHKLTTRFCLEHFTLLFSRSLLFPLLLKTKIFVKSIPYLKFAVDDSEKIDKVQE